MLRIRLTRAPQTHSAYAVATPGKLSALDAAAKVLAEECRAMGARDVVAAMPATGYWTSPGGKTSITTLYSANAKGDADQGDAVRFTKAEPGKFDLAARG